MTFAASAATWFVLKASEAGWNGSSRLGNEKLFSRHAFSRAETELAIKLDKATSEEAMRKIGLLLLDAFDIYVFLD